MFSFQYDLNGGVTHKWSSNPLSWDIASISVIDTGMTTEAHDIGTPEACSGSGPWKLGPR
jgi:hypothetical protein